ncbi:MAG: hypothetical protein P4M08_02440 [Oligoflexia bacterium]|nr:hypothetical protein [Oligoflexia bacterium]
MRTLTKSLLTLVLALSAVSAYAGQPDATIKADAQAINSACAADGQTASCGTETFGHGLLKCIFAYKKANPNFKISDSCKAAMKQFHADKSAGK